MFFTVDRAPRIIGRTLMLVALALLLNGCSALRLGYAGAPDLLAFWLGRYVEVDDNQRPLLRQALTEVHDWHRATQLAPTADLLRRLHQMAPRDVTEREACAVADEARALLSATAARFADALAPLSAQLTPAQMRQLEQAFERRNTDWRRDWMGPDALARRVQRSVERAERFYGPLSPQQRAVVEATVARSGFRAEVSLQQQLRQQGEMLRVLGQPARQPEARELLRRLLSLEGSTDDERAYRNAMARAGCEALAAIHNSTTPAQRERAARALRDHEADLRALMGR